MNSWPVQIDREILVDMLLAGLMIAAVSLDAGIQALESLRVEEAVEFFERAKGEGPYDLKTYRLLYEKLGTAYAYLDQPEKAQEAFTHLLLLDRGYKLSPGASPKVVAPFEWARYQVAREPEATIDIQWPTVLRGGARSLPATLTIGGNPKNVIHTVKISLVTAAGPRAETSARAGGVGVPVRLELALPSRPEEGGSLKVSYLVRGLDRRGNEAFGIGSVSAPLSIRIPYEETASWYESWWFWSLLGGAAAAGGIAAGVVLSRDAPEQQPLTFIPRDAP